MTLLRLQNIATAGCPAVSADVAAGEWVTLGDAQAGAGSAWRS